MRVGNTVRRPYGPWVPSTQALLRHLETHEFPAPRPLGIDESGREILSWVPGSSAWDEHARYWSSSESLVQAAKLVRRLHDVLDLFDPPDDAVWRGGWGRPEDGKGPICHNDLAPYNFVVADDGALGIIDWDGSGPGDRMAELAGAIRGFALLRRDSLCKTLGWSSPPNRAGRVEVFFHAYGFPNAERQVLADALVEHARGGVAFSEKMHADGREPFASWWAEDQGAGDREDLLVTERVVADWLKLASERS